jgi:hypothetical protein
MMTLRHLRTAAVAKRSEALLQDSTAHESATLAQAVLNHIETAHNDLLDHIRAALTRARDSEMDPGARVRPVTASVRLTKSLTYDGAIAVAVEAAFDEEHSMDVG